MTRRVVDASVAAKWVLPEVHSDAALRLLEPEYRLAAPDLLYSLQGTPLAAHLLWIEDSGV